MIIEENLRKIGQFTKTHGIKGEISLFSDYEIAVISCTPYIVCNMDGIWVPFFINSCRQKSASVMLITFENIDSEEKVKQLSGKIAYIPSELLPPDNDHPVHAKHVIGYTLIDERIGIIGQVINVDNSTQNILLTVDYNGSEILVPLAYSNTLYSQKKEINVLLPDNFLDIFLSHETAK